MNGAECGLMVSLLARAQVWAAGLGFAGWLAGLAVGVARLGRYRLTLE